MTKTIREKIDLLFLRAFLAFNRNKIVRRFLPSLSDEKSDPRILDELVKKTKAKGFAGLIRLDCGPRS